MANTWITSDIHFGHKNIIKFKKPSGSPIRPGFTDDAGTFHTFGDDIRYHDESYITRWNERVAPEDTVWVLGDIGHPIENFDRMNGKKYLILGNHDDIHEAKWRELFDASGNAIKVRVDPLAQRFHRVLSQKVFSKEFAHPVMFCHYPLHADETKPATRRICVHGHIHEKLISRPVTIPGYLGPPGTIHEADPWFINVCVEHTNHAPMSWDELSNIVGARVERLRKSGEIL